MAELRPPLEVDGLDGRGWRGVGVREVEGLGHHGKETCVPYGGSCCMLRLGWGVYSRGGPLISGI